MTPDRLMSGLGSAGLPVALAAVLGLVVALGAAGAWGAGVRLPAVAAGAAVGLPAWAAWAFAPGGGDLDAMTANAAIRLVAPVAIGLPAGGMLLFASLFAALKGPRRVVAPIVGIIAVLVTAGVVWASAEAIDETTFAPARAVGYALLGLFAAIGLLAGDRAEGVGPECAASAGVAFVALVLAGEASALAMPELVLALNVQSVAVADRAVFVGAFVDQAITIARPWAWGAVAAASAFGVAGVATAGADPRRVALGAAGLVWLLPGLLTVATPTRTAAWAAAVAAVPAPPAPVTPAPGAAPGVADPPPTPNPEGEPPK